MNRVRQSAFTLIELVVVLLIMGTVGSVIVACFMGGVRAYERARDFGRGETDVYIAFEMLERDLKNAVWVPGFPFMGEPSLMQFASKRSEPVEDVGMGLDVVKIQYLERDGDGVSRSSSGFGETVVGDSEVWDTLLAGDVAMCLAFSEGADAGHLPTWVETWQSESNLPRQVRVQFTGGEFGDAGIERIITIPVAGE